SPPASLASCLVWLKFRTDMLPAILLGALAAGQSLPVLVFGVLLCCALAAVVDLAEPFVAVCESRLGAFFKMTEWVVSLSP
ncbi:cation:dicarboxylase symporter family transporter, partial [Burkholderia pseudomallei]